MGLKPRRDGDPFEILTHGDAPEVLAAGGIITRPGPGGLDELVLVHRPGYDDWSFPKGKLDAGETAEEGALREVLEETGLRCRLVAPLGCTRYIDRKGRDKIACYWAMEVVESTGWLPTNEVDEVRWLTVHEAMELLSYDRDRALLEGLELAA